MVTANFCRLALISSTMTIFIALAMVSSVVGFTPTLTTRSYSIPTNGKSIWELNSMEAQGEDLIPEGGDGGVKLARESAIKITGGIQYKPGNAESSPEDLLRYNNLKTVDGPIVQNVMGSTGTTILCYGQGVEDYKDPGETTIKEVDYCPREAVKDAITNSASAAEVDNLVLNFLGGDDLILGEVLEAANELVLALGVPTNANIRFNSLSHSSIPSGTCSVTAVAVGNQPNDSLAGVELAVAQGEVYSRDGTWYTVEESDINDAVA